MTRVPENEDGENAQIGATVEWQVTGQGAVGVQLQVIPSFDVKGMHTGSMKDICRLDDTYIFPYRCQKPIGACNFDVLKTPKEESLQVGDVIHIKNMKTRRENHKKVVGDLLAEAPINLTRPCRSQSTLVARADLRLIRRCYVLVVILGSHKTFQSWGGIALLCAGLCY